MIDIRIEGESADLLPGMNLTLERFSPLFSFETIQGSRVYGFELPNTPTNRKLLGYFYQDQVGYQSRRFRCEKYVHGQLIEQGYVMIHETKPGGEFSCFFTQNLGEIFGDAQTVPLSELGLAEQALSLRAEADHLTDRYCLPTIQNDGFYGNQAVGGFTGLVNEYHSGSYNAVARVPLFFLRWVFERFGQLTGWRFTGQFWQDSDLLRLVLYNTYSLDGQTLINANNHLPALTLPQLLIELRKLFNLHLEFDVYRRVCTMDFADEVLRGGQIVDWTDKAQPQHTKAPDLASRLALSYELDSNDALMKPVPVVMDSYTTPETVINEGGTLLPIRSRLSTLLTDPVSGRAMTQQAGISPFNKDGKSAATPRLLFWHGLVNGVPMATSTHGSRSLLWHGPDNLAERGYRSLEQLKADTFTLSKVVFLSPADLALFSFRRKVHIRGVNYLVTSLKAALSTQRQAIPTEVGLLRV